MKAFFTCFLLLVLMLQTGFGQRITGTIEDEFGQPIPFATVRIKGDSRGVVADEVGFFDLEIKRRKAILEISALGFEPLERAVAVSEGASTKRMDVQLKVQAKDLEAFEVVADKRDRAKEIMKRVRERRQDFRANYESFSVDVYYKTSLEKVRKGDPAAADTLLPMEYRVIRLDSSTDTVFVPYIDALVEMKSTLHRTASGRVKEEIKAIEDRELKPLIPSTGRSLNVEADYDFPTHSIAPVTVRATNPYVLFPDHASAEIDFYQNLLTLPKLTMKPLLSPIASASALSYLYDYEGGLVLQGQKAHKIKVTPILASEALYSGHIYVADSSWALLEVSLEVNPQALLYCEWFKIEQTYADAGDSTYLPSALNLSYEIKETDWRILGKASASYGAYTLNPTFDRGFFNAEIKTFDPAAFDRDTAYWLEERPTLLDASEVRFIDQSDSLDLYYVSDEYYAKIDSAYNRIDWWTPLIGLGHRNRQAGYEWYVEGLLGQINPIGVGGYRHQLPVHLKRTFDDGKILEADVRPNYGFYNQDFKLKAGVGYTYFPKKFVRTYVEFGDFYERINDFSSFEQIFARSNYVNALTFGISQRMEVFNGFFADLQFRYSDQKPITNVRVGPWEEAIFGNLAQRLPFDRYVKSEFQLDIQYRFRQKYFIKNNRKIIVGSDYPELYGVWRKGVPSLFGSEVNFDYVELGLRDDVRLARWGELHWQLLGGTFTNNNNLRILEYKYLRGSDRYFFSDPTRSLQLLGPTFATPFPFVQANYIHHFEGTLLNKVPLLNKLRLELAVGGAGLFVSENDFTQVELFAGLERVVRIKEELFRFGIYAVSVDNNIDPAAIRLKFGVNFFNSFTNKWDY